MKILITAGATWVKIDEVRILTTIFTGKTGIFLAEEFQKKGYNVTLFLNAHCIDKKIKGIKVFPFTYFDDFKKKIRNELAKTKYDAIIHSAAVSDYKLRKPFMGKIPSGEKEITLKLIPAEKVIKVIRKMTKKSILIQFKLEIERDGLIDKAYNSLKENKSDFVVANSFHDLIAGYKSYLLDKDKHITLINSKKELFSELYKLIVSKNA